MLHNTSLYVNVPPTWRDTEHADVFALDKNTLLVKKVNDEAVLREIASVTNKNKE